VQPSTPDKRSTVALVGKQPDTQEKRKRGRPRKNADLGGPSRPPNAGPLTKGSPRKKARKEGGQIADGGGGELGAVVNPRSPGGTEPAGKGSRTMVKIASLDSLNHAQAVIGAADPACTCLPPPLDQEQTFVP